MKTIEITSVVHCFFSQKQRLPCLPSSMVALETLLGIDTTIDFEDFLNGNNGTLFWLLRFDVVMRAFFFLTRSLLPFTELQ